jgi:hypothetical protein
MTEKTWTLIGSATFPILSGPLVPPGERVVVARPEDVAQEIAEAIRKRPMEFRGEGRDRVGVIPSKEDWAEFVESFGKAENG